VTRCIVLLIPFLFAPLFALDAQPVPRVAVEGGVVLTTMRLGGFQQTNPGLGFEAQGRIAFCDLSLGAGFLRTIHEVEQSPEEIIMSGLFVEPRYAFAIGTHSSIFLTSRVARLTRAWEPTTPSSPGSDRDAGIRADRSTGYAVGAGGGAELAMGSTLRLTMAAIYSRVSLGDLTAPGGTVFAGSATTGSGLLLRAGLSLALDHR
jgi:hypothetical protein